MREPDDIDLLVGRRIRQRRRDLGLSQSDVARLLGLRLALLQHYEAGASRPRPAQLAAIAELLQMPIARFFLEPPLANQAAISPLDQGMVGLPLTLTASAGSAGNDRSEGADG